MISRFKSRFYAPIALALVILVSVPWMVFASDWGVSVVDATAPTGSVTLAPTGSAPITINLSVTGKQDGTATFKVYRDWALSGGVFTGSNPITFTVPARDSKDEVTTFTTTGVVTVAAGQADGAFNLEIGAFDITNSNTTGAKLDRGTSSSYEVIVVTPSTPADTTPPVLTLPSDMTVEATGPTGATVTFTATAVDDVDGPVSVTCTPASGSVFPLGETIVNCEATDSSSNKATGSFKITVVDTTPPVLTLPSNMLVYATGSTGATVTFTATANDLVDGSVPVTCTPASGSVFPLGETTVTCTATDNAGNTATGSFKVRVIYDWSGVLQPINRENNSLFKLGSTIPVKFKLTGASSGISNVTAKIYLTKISNGVVDGDEEMAVSTSAASSGNTFRYDSESDQYIFNLGTKSLSEGTYQIRIDLGDGTLNTILISLKK